MPPTVVSHHPVQYPALLLCARVLLHNIADLLVSLAMRGLFLVEGPLVAPLTNNV